MSYYDAHRIMYERPMSLEEADFRMDEAKDEYYCRGCGEDLHRGTERYCDSCLTDEADWEMEVRADDLRD